MAFVHIKLILRRFQLRLTRRSDGKANGQPAACCNAVNIMDDRQAQTASLIIIGKGTRIPSLDAPLCHQLGQGLEGFLIPSSPKVYWFSATNGFKHQAAIPMIIVPIAVKIALHIRKGCTAVAVIAVDTLEQLLL